MGVIGMQKYSMTCTCGQVMSVDAVNRDEAVSKMKTMMNEEAVKMHFADKHKGQMVPPMTEVHMNIVQMLALAM